MLSTPLGVIEWFVYLLAAVMFVIGLHLMNSPKTARKGNMVSAIGMVFAVAMAFIVLFAGEASNGFKHGVAVIVLIVGIVIGAVAGVVSAKKVKMTDMPQLVSVFNTVGGGAAALVALNDILTSAETPSIVVLITAGLGIMIGSVTFSGSLIAAGKLQGIKWVKKLSLPGKGFWNILFVVLTIVSFVMLCVQPNQRLLWSILTTVFALCYGLVFVIPIGGADMPVVISVLNASDWRDDSCGTTSSCFYKAIQIIDKDIPFNWCHTKTVFCQVKQRVLGDRWQNRRTQWRHKFVISSDSKEVCRTNFFNFGLSCWIKINTIGKAFVSREFVCLKRSGIITPNFCMSSSTRSCSVIFSYIKIARS